MTLAVAGIGCRKGCTAEDIAGLLRACLDEAGMDGDARARLILAAPARKAEEPGIAGAARLLSLPLRLIDDAALHAAQDRVQTRSARVEAAVGLASVAEAAALAAAGPGARLLLPRRSSPAATCAIAVLEELP